VYKRQALRYQRKIKGFDTASMKNLYHAEWPGNIRELRNVVERCVILSDTPIMSWPDQPQVTKDDDDTANIQFPATDFPSLERIEQEYIEHVLEHSGGKKTKAADILGIDKTTLWRKLRRFNQEE